MKKAVLLIVLVWISCEPRQGQQVQDGPPKAEISSAHKIVAKEVIQANNYTYLKADENGKEIWIAMRKQDVEVGKTYYYTQGMEMKNFRSKDLDRIFETILFMEEIYDTPDGKSSKRIFGHDDNIHKGKRETQRQHMNIQHADGETSIGDLYNNKETLEHKKVAVKGLVTKYNPGIMNRNWVHLQDGTGGEATFDLTITTMDRIEVGSLATFEGIVAVDKDFGHGYKYDLLLEDAVLLNQEPEVKVN